MQAACIAYLAPDVAQLMLRMSCRRLLTDGILHHLQHLEAGVKLLYTGEPVLEAMWTEGAHAALAAAFHGRADFTLDDFTLIKSTQCSAEHRPVLTRIVQWLKHWLQKASSDMLNKFAEYVTAEKGELSWGTFVAAVNSPVLSACARFS